MLPAAVSRVDHGRVRVAGGDARGAGGWMAQHDGVGPEPVEGYHGVQQRFALGDRRAFFGERDHVGPAPARRELEGDGGPGGGLEERQADGFPGERVAQASIGVRPGKVEDGLYLPAADALERQGSL